MSLNHINSFDTDNPKKLSRQLSDLEDNVDAEFRSARATLVPQPTISTFQASATLGIVAVLPDTQTSIDTSAAAAAAVFPELKAENFGRRFIVIKRKAANNIVTSCRDTAVLCNGAAFPVLAAVGRYEFTCDASGYYR